MTVPVSARVPRSGSKTPKGVVNIQVRGVPEDLHKRLKARAALQGMSLSDMLLHELGLIASRKSNAEILRDIEAREPVHLPENYVADLIRSMRGDI